MTTYYRSRESASRTPRSARRPIDPQPLLRALQGTQSAVEVGMAGIVVRVAEEHDEPP
jgi:hypothetical protein